MDSDSDTTVGELKGRRGKIIRYAVVVVVWNVLEDFGGVSLYSYYKYY